MAAHHRSHPLSEVDLDSQEVFTHMGARLTPTLHGRLVSDILSELILDDLKKQQLIVDRLVVLHATSLTTLIKLSYHRGTYPGQELDYRFRTNVEVRTESGRMSANSWEAMNPPRLLGDMKVLKRRGGFDITASLTNPPSFKRVIELGPYGNNPWELA